MNAIVKYFHDGGAFMDYIIFGTLRALTLLIELTIFCFQTGVHRESALYHNHRAYCRNLRLFFFQHASIS